jgi:hypothetical protein
MLFSTLALQGVRANPTEMARFIHIMQYPQPVDDDSDDDDGIYLPRYDETGLLSSDDVSESASIYSFNSGESDTD